MNVITIIRCLECKGEVEQVSDDKLICRNCHRSYNKQHNVYDFMSDLKSEKTSIMWQKKIYLFQHWRSEQQQYRPSSDKNTAFYKMFGDFMSIHDGVVLDIGCGSGTIKKFIRPSMYVGVDPIPIQGRDFPLFRSIGERLPFKDASFDHVIMRQVLDHCLDASRTFLEAARIVKNAGTIHVFQYITDGSIRLPGYIISTLLRKVGLNKKVHSWETKTQRFTSKSFKQIVLSLFGAHNVQIIERFDIAAILAKIKVLK